MCNYHYCLVGQIFASRQQVNPSDSQHTYIPFTLTQSIDSHNFLRFESTPHYKQLSWPGLLPSRSQMDSPTPSSRFSTTQHPTQTPLLATFSKSPTFVTFRNQSFAFATNATQPSQPLHKHVVKQQHRQAQPPSLSQRHRVFLWLGEQSHPLRQRWARPLGRPAHQAHDPERHHECADPTEQQHRRG